MSVTFRDSELRLVFGSALALSFAGEACLMVTHKSLMRERMAFDTLSSVSWDSALCSAVT